MMVDPEPHSRLSFTWTVHVVPLPAGNLQGVVMTFSRFGLSSASLWVTTLSLAALTGCATSHDQEQEPVVVSSSEDVEFIPKGSSSDQIDAAVTSAEKLVEQQPAFVEADVGDEISNATTRQIPIEINEDVERWVEYFTVRDRERFKRFLERGSRYKSMITAVLKDQGIPTELYYQAMIESGFTVHATSTASAVGIWQFIPGTGRRYGLRIDHYVDERRDPMRATIAAALYMKDLYNVFQDWYLALGAYNAGEGRILGSIMRSKTRDFWEMVRKRSLPVETMNYIPKFIAATTIGHDLKRYGFDDLALEIPSQLVAVYVASPVKMADIARVSGIPLDTLNEYNPNIRRGVTPPGQDTYRLWVPKDLQDKLASKQEQIASLRLRNLRYVAATDNGGSVAATVHTVRRGEHLSLISKKYNMTVVQLKRLNNLKSNQLRVGQRLKVSSAAVVASENAAVKTQAARTVVKYRVQRGDNLGKIARKFNTSVPEIKRLNNMKRNTIAVGQVITVNNRKG